MVEAGALTCLPKGQYPMVVNPIGVVRAPHSNKVRRVINMRCVNTHLAKKMFTFEGLSDLVVIA
jgi:hypothetical protein